MWNAVPITPTAVKTGRPYWVAILASAGTLVLRGRPSGSCTSNVSPNGKLTLPARSRHTAQRTSRCVLSAYAMGAEKITLTHAPVASVPTQSTAAPSQGSPAQAQTTPTASLPSGSPPTLSLLPPVNVGAPTISGTAQQGQTLTASTGSWLDSPTSYAYQWQDCSSTSCSAISGATQSTYTLQGSDVGHAIDVVVTATNADGSSSAASSKTSAVTPLPAPTNTALPAISGTAQQNRTLSAANGSWTNNPTSYVYQWQDCTSSSCSNISGATGSTYTLQSSDVGDTVDVVVTASNAGGSGSATSAKTVTVLPAAPSSTALPAISGTPQQGQTLSVSNGSWTNNPTSYTYQWQDCTSSSCSNVSGATSSTYTLQASDVGDTIDVAVTATNAGGSGSATSGKTATVTPPAPSNTALPAITGTAQQDQALTATAGSWTNNPTSYAYQWQDCSGSACTSISGATGSTYTLQSTDVGEQIDVVVTATNAGGSASATSATVGPVSSVTPSVSAVTTSNVTSTGATFTATVNPNGISTNVAFEYGPTTSYGSTTPNQNIGSGTTAQTVTATVTGLTPGTSYHVRAVATQ